MARERDALVDRHDAGAQSVVAMAVSLGLEVDEDVRAISRNVMFYMGAAWPTLRTLARELGQRLTDAGFLAEPEDVYYLDSAEITAAIHARAQGQPQPALVELVQRTTDTCAKHVNN